jgi:hypothetical protein
MAMQEKNRFVHALKTTVKSFSKIKMEVLQWKRMITATILFYDNLSLDVYNKSNVLLLSSLLIVKDKI